MFDVCIIGAGPSGSIAAYELSKAGYKVCLIEKKKTIGIPVQCGETTTLNGLRQCDVDLDDSWVKNTMKGCKIILPDEHFFYSSSPWVNIDRAVFDQYLAQRADDNGCTVLKNTKMKNLVFDKNHWSVKTSKNPVDATIIIGADGPLSKTAEFLGIHPKKGTYITGFQYKFSRENVHYDETEWLSLFMDPGLNGGYKWVFPRGDEFNIGLGGFKMTRALLDEFCTFLGIDVKKHIVLSGGLLPFLFEFNKRIGRQSCVVGDAAGMVNPSTGAGIHAGMRSARIASRYIIKALEQDDMNLIKAYDNSILNTPFLHPVHKKTVEYFLQWNRDDWSNLGAAAHGVDMADLSLMKSFFIGLKHPSLFLKSKELLTIRRSMQMNRLYS